MSQLKVLGHLLINVSDIKFIEWISIKLFHVLSIYNTNLLLLNYVL